MINKRVIVSLTSYPPAIRFVRDVALSILNGTVKPDKIVLYLTFSQFGENELPSDLIELQAQFPIFEIRNYDEEIRSYRKLIPALIDFPNDIIITIDDDVAYNKNMLQSLLRLHKLYPAVIFAHRAKQLSLDKPYRTWKKYRWYKYLFKKHYHRYGNIFTGVGGVLYPPNSLKAEMLDSKLFRELAPTTDDIWFWAAAVANNTKIAPVPFGYSKPKGLGKPKELALKTHNFKSGVDENKAALDRILKKYPRILEAIEDEFN
jgi:hypothetical protein